MALSCSAQINSGMKHYFWFITPCHHHHPVLSFSMPQILSWGRTQRHEQFYSVTHCHTHQKLKFQSLNGSFSVRCTTSYIHPHFSKTSCDRPCCHSEQQKPHVKRRRASGRSRATAPGVQSEGGACPPIQSSLNRRVVLRSG